MRGKGYFSILQGLKIGWKGFTAGGQKPEKKLHLSNIYLFATSTEKYIGHSKQDEKGVLDLVESTMRPTGLEKEELQLTLSNLGQSRHKITTIRVCTFEKSGIFSQRSQQDRHSDPATPSLFCSCI